MMRTATVFAALFTGVQAISDQESIDKSEMRPETAGTNTKQVENDGDDFAEEFKNIQDMLSDVITAEQAEKLREMFKGTAPKTKEEAQKLQEELMSIFIPENIKSNMKQLQECLERVKILARDNAWRKDASLITETAEVLKKSMIAMDLPEEQAGNIADQGAPIALFLSAVTGIEDSESAGEAEDMNRLATKIFAHMSSEHQNRETMIDSVKESLSDAKEMLEVVMRKYKKGTSSGMAYLATEAENAMKSILDQTSEDMAENFKLVFGDAAQIPMGELNVDYIANALNGGDGNEAGQEVA